MHFSTDRTAHTTAFDGPGVDHWLKWKIVQAANASTMQDRCTMQEDPNLYSKVLYCLSYVQPTPLYEYNIYGIYVTHKDTPMGVNDSGNASSEGCEHIYLYIYIYHAYVKG